jgi:chaperonin cofactor prefoldin
MQRTLLYILLFVLVTGAVLMFNKKLEFLTMQEVDDKATKLSDRVDSIEDDYKKLQVKLESQQGKMDAAAGQAKDAQAFLSQPMD